jgi:cytochrome c biogenesis protein CcmG, thiol:disulfide interchange protein DsbE
MKRAMIVALASVLSLSLAQSSYNAPDFRLMDTNGKIVQLSSFKGKPVVVNFWATWCHVCQEELPKINAVYKRLPGKFVFLAVHRDPSIPIKDIKAWVKNKGWAFPAIVDAPAGTKNVDTINAVSSRYQVFGTPYFFFIDKNGVLKAINPGGMSAETLKQNLALIGVQ